MPIRRAPVAQEKAPAAAAEKEEDGGAEVSPPADEEEEEAAASSVEAADGEQGEAADEEPKENGEAEENSEVKDDNEGKKDDKCKDCASGQCATHCYVLLLRMKDGYKYEKSKSKKMKRTIPAWASITSKKKIRVTNFSGSQHKLDNILIEALLSFNSRTGVSFQSLMKYMLNKYPEMELERKKFLIKKAMNKHLEKGSIKQLKGKGLSGTFAMGKQSPQSKKSGAKQESLGDALPLIITRLCEPKEASYNLIKKYVEQHFPSLNIENRPDILKSALLRAVEKGLLEQITGKGASGTFQLKRSGNKAQKGSVVEDAITVAIAAMNEPKTCSTTTLRKYLVDANKTVRENLLVANLRRTLKKCKVLGWMEQITGHGFTGTYQLSFPFYPSPTILYPDKFKDNPKEPAKRRRRTDSSDEESEEEPDDEDSEEESEDEAPPKKRARKRPPPRVRRPPPAKKPRSSSQSKAKGGGRAPAKSPAKKAASPAKRPGRKQPAAKKEPEPPRKATPAKKGAAPARKPKAPAAKRLSQRGSKKPESRESSPARSESDESESEKSSIDEPVAKKPAARGGRGGGAGRGRGGKKPAPKPATPKSKKAAKATKKPARKSKRGRN